MIDLSLAGLIGAMLGAAMAGVVYHLGIGTVERAVRARSQSTPAGEGGDVSLAVIRRIVLTLDLLVLAALGYWLGRLLEA